MKLPFSNSDCRLPIADCPANSQTPIFNHKSQIANRKFQRGVALIITLILLAVVTVMAVAFLATSTRERGAVATATDTAGARLAADAALAQAEAQIMANVLATTNPYSFGLLVSTNYIPFTTGNSLDDLTNMWISPRAPVWLSNTVTRVMENRFYLDLNRNGVDDPNQNDTNFVAETNSAGNLITNIGDPEWIGVLDHPDQPHGPNNRFIARYAFVAVPIGNALDLNAIHNQARADEANGLIATANDTFMRNQGVGSWEINLAGFLADLNTNQWGQIVGSGASAPPGSANWYQYNEPSTINFGNAFDDARALLAYRYDNNFANLPNANSLFFNSAMLQDDDIDEYSDGPLQVTTPSIDESMPANQDVTSLPWAGADNTNHFFDMQELFANPNNTFPNFTNRLLIADADTNSTYDRYTFYRLLAQLGTDSAPEQDKMNLNYDNLDANGNVIPGAETNFIPWTTEQNVNMNGVPVSGALKFFTFAADRMLRAYSQDWLARDSTSYLATYFTTNTFGITDIPVLVSNQFVYSSAINRVLQLAANMYDATTNTFFPSVFRPTFNVIPLGNGYTNVYVNGYKQVFSVIGPSDTQLNLPVDVTTLLSGESVVNYADGVNVYGVPWIIGAKKGFPNFNEFAMENTFQLTRKLQVTRQSLNARYPSQYQFNQMFNLSVTNQLGVECWNSYTNNFTDPVTIYATDVLTNILINDEGFSTNMDFTLSGSLTVNPWPGANPTANPLSFQIPLINNVAVVPDSTYRFNGPYLINPPSLTYESNVMVNVNGVETKYPQPNWGLIVTNDLRVIMLDGTNVIDYVQLRGPISNRTNLDAEIIGEWDKPNYTNAYDGLWDTNLDGQSIPWGIDNQLEISLGRHGLGSGPNGWYSTDPVQVSNEISGFLVFCGYGPYSGYTNDIGLDSTTNNLQAPYTPTATIVQHIDWQANDPLVHYLASDLNWAGASRFDITVDDLTNENLGQLNNRYMPWGGHQPINPNLPNDPNTLNAYNLTVKDPLVWQSDDWDFPTYKLPTVGWLGRVHRGTPWQTVDLKSAQPSLGNWVTNWTGDLNLFDAYNSSPAADWQLFDLFTTAPNDNATRGQLSVNIGAPNGSSLAAWSALFSGVVALTNTTPVPNQITPITYSSLTVPPAGAYNTALPPALVQIVSGINQTRSTFTNADGLAGSFEHVGDILSVPQLTVQSPFLNTNAVQQLYGISDEMYEWLPQQTLSLLRASGTPQSPMRYVIYCYGQTLKPAPNGIVTGGTLFGICTNYQVVAEAATRAVVQFGSTRISNIFPTNINVGDVLVSTLTNVPSVTSNNAVIESFNVLPPN